MQSEMTKLLSPVLQKIQRTLLYLCAVHDLWDESAGPRGGGEMGFSVCRQREGIRVQVASQVKDARQG